MSNVIVAEERKLNGKKVRRLGFVPGVIYGPGVGNSLNVQFNKKEINKFLREHSIGSKAKVKLKDNEHLCVVKDIHYGLVNREPIHIDFYASSADSAVKVTVPFKFVGKEKLTENRLVLNILENEIEIQGALKDLPEFIEVDVSQMAHGSELTMADIALPAGVRLLSKEDMVVAKAVKAESEPEPEAEAGTESGTEEKADVKESA